MDLWRSIKTLRQRKWLFLVIFIVTVAAVVLIPRGNVEVVFESSAKILLTPPSRVGDRPDQNNLWFSNQTTLSELVTSEKLVRRVAERLGTPDQWEELRERIEFRNPDSGGMYRFSQGNVTLFYLVAQAADPEESQKIASSLVDEFVSYVQDLSAQEFANTRRYLEELVAEAQEKVEDVEGRLLAITANKSATESESSLENEANLENERLKLKEQVSTLQSEVAVVEDFLAGRTDSPPWSLIEGRDQTINQLENAVSTERLKLIELREVYTDDSRQVREQAAKLAKVEQLYHSQRDSVANSLHTEKVAALTEKRAQLSRVTQQLLELRKKRLTPEEKREVASLERQLSMWEENHLNLVKQLYQARVTEQSSRRQGAIQVLEKPGRGRPPELSRLPSLLKSLLVGVPFGLLVAAGTVLGLEYWNTSLQFVPQVEQILDLPVLVAIPKVPDDLATEWEQVKTQQFLSEP